MSATILIIEDDENLTALLRRILQRDGYRVLQAADGEEGILIVKERSPDLILLDLMLPHMSGWETCERIRAFSDVPIIMLTALESERNIVKGLELGADDYIVKPFRSEEFRARIQAVLRRHRFSLPVDSVVQIDDRLSVDLARNRIVVDGEVVPLSGVEHKLLKCFLDHAGHILTHEYLLTQVWGWENVEQTQYLKVYVYQLRKKLEKDPREPHYLLTERRLGYRFEPPLG
jgi:DNA-binding response OmpR family regulator